MISRRVGGADAWFTDRHGGVSSQPFASLNLAGHVGDDPTAVSENRTRVRTAIGLVQARWIQPLHVHGTTVHAVTDEARDATHDLALDGTGPDGLMLEADGVATSRRGVVLSALGADCAPIAIANDTACAAVHAGWRGALGGVVQAGVAAVRALGHGPVRAVIGPCVCGVHYEFGEELLRELVAKHGPEVATTTGSGAPAFDLRAAIRLAFTRADVSEVEVLDVCTVESSDHFSHRRDGVTGRHGVVVVNR